MRNLVEKQGAPRAFGTASDYLRSLIRAEQQRVGTTKLERLLLEGIDQNSHRIQSEPQRFRRLSDEDQGLD
jgi:hypothetical protein